MFIFAQYLRHCHREQWNAQCHCQCSSVHTFKTDGGHYPEELSWKSPNLAETLRWQKCWELLGDKDFQYLPVNSKLDDSFQICRSLFIFVSEFVCVFVCCVCERERENVCQRAHKHWSSERNHLWLGKKRNTMLCCTFQICQRFKKVIAKDSVLCCRHTVNVWSGPEGKAGKT